jgi:hypothetical protein
MVAACLFVVAACGPSNGQSAPNANASPSFGSSPMAATSPSPSAAPAGSSTVFVIVMENRSYGQAMAGGYTAQLAATYGVAANYHGVSHPSLPNYLAHVRQHGTPTTYHPLPLTAWECNSPVRASAGGPTWRA